jgi:predicted amidohydrolase
VVVTFHCGGFCVAPFVCYDLRFPEIFRTAALRGANLFVVSALWPIKRQQHWLTLLQARAIENQAFVVGANRVGSEPQFHYAGRSVVINPHGIIIADAANRRQSSLRRSMSNKPKVAPRFSCAARRPLETRVTSSVA